MFISMMRNIIFVTVVALLGAKARTMLKVKAEHPEWDESTIRSKLVGYCSGKVDLNFKFLLEIFFWLRCTIARLLQPMNC